jgi:PHP family Zn ribbon phosphoesterase
MVQELGGELNVLTAASESDLGRVANAKVAACVMAVRNGKVQIEAGYDGVYGKVTAALRDNQ